MHLSRTENPSAELLAARKPERVMHELRLRQTTVRHTERIGAHMLRVVVTGDDLADFHSPGFDDHMKLLFPDANGDLPDLSAGLASITPDLRANMRDYTPRAFDATQQQLTIDFVLHQAGPATAWAAQAQPGQKLAIAGPRGSFVTQGEFDGYLLIGDDAALPAIARRLAELPVNAQVAVVAEVDGQADELVLNGPTNPTIKWVHRNGGPAGTSDGLLQELADLSLPDGDWHCWVAAEAGVARALRTELIDEYDAHPKWVKAAAYWKHGSNAVNEVIDD